MATRTLLPCDRCLRHFRVDAESCPFCGGGRASDKPSWVTQPMKGLTRGAWLALGAPVLGATLTVTACAGSQQSDDGSIALPYGVPPQPPEVDGRVWTIAGTPGTLKMADRASFQLTISVTNKTLGPIDPERGAIEIMLGGAPCAVCNLAFGNGVLDPAWLKLERDATATDSRNIGEALFDKPGVYELVLRYKGVQVSRTTVTVE